MRVREGMRWGLAAALFAASLVAAPAGAQEKAWSLDLGVDYSTHYLFRGVPLLGDNEVITPHAAFGVGGLNVYYYGYFGDIPADFTASGSEESYQEADFGADYTFSFGERFSWTVGAVSYMYSGTVEDQYGFFDTYELYTMLSWDVMLAPTVSYWHDMDAVEGGYLQLGISNSWPLSDKVSLDFSAALGLDFGYNLNDALAADLGVDASSGDLNDVLIGLDVPVQVNDWFSFHAMVQQSIALDVLDDLGIDDETVFTGGVGFTF